MDRKQRIRNPSRNRMFNQNLDTNFGNNFDLRQRIRNSRRNRTVNQNLGTNFGNNCDLGQRIRNSSRNRTVNQNLVTNFDNFLFGNAVETRPFPVASGECINTPFSVNRDDGVVNNDWEINAAVQPPNLFSIYQPPLLRNGVTTLTTNYQQENAYFANTNTNSNRIYDGKQCFRKRRNNFSNNEADRNVKKLKLTVANYEEQNINSANRKRNRKRYRKRRKRFTNNQAVTNTKRLKVTVTNSEQQNANSVTANPNRNANTEILGAKPHCREEGKDFANNSENMNEAKLKRDNKMTVRKFHFGFKRLEELSNQDTHTVLINLLDKKLGLEELLESDLSNDTIILIVKIFMKLCSTPFLENKTDIVNMASEVKFIKLLTDFIIKIPLQDEHDKKRNTYFWNNAQEFFSNLSVICTTIISIIPTRACEVLQKIIKAAIITLDNLELDIKIKDDFKKLEKKLFLCREEIECKKIKAHTNTEIEENPPDDFRELSVYPLCQEITTKERAFVRKHIIKGPYQNVDHYLDVQFRLLKEDLVGPLREGICEFIDQHQNQSKFPNIRVYRNSVFLNPTIIQGNKAVLLQFLFPTKNKKQKTVKFKYTKRFMFGSLLCFTKDNFQSLFFGKVVERNPELLEKGQVLVGFEAGNDLYELNEPYIMIESTVYFEPYYHVLNALQATKEEKFPMKKYIIDVNPDIEAPDYLNPDSGYTINEQNVMLFQTEQWPSANALKLNDTQYDAFKAALTQKFVVIQGPPGTGKTFLGLKIVKTLIQNKEHWYKGTPILVISFTNHALDQFLEGLIGTTSDIIRVGGQSKNEKLNSFNLRVKQTNIKLLQNIYTAMRNLKFQVADCLNQIRTLSANLEEIDKYENVINFEYFAEIDRDFENSWFSNTSEKNLVEWLFGGRTVEKVSMMQPILVNEQMENLIETGEDEDSDKEGEMQFHAELQANREFQDLNDVDTLPAKLTNLSFLTGIKQLTGEMQLIEQQINALGNVDDQAIFNKKCELEIKLVLVQHNLVYLKENLNKGQHLKVPCKPQDCNFKVPYTMMPKDRWKLYFYWLNLYKTYLQKQLLQLQSNCNRMYHKLKEIQDIKDTQVMKQMLVVGMTTTCSARLQRTLQALQCRIVIVEEAAEVLESHIIVSLTNHCEHLILIGDHQQLRPNTANYIMNRRYNLGISLFERMILNNIQNYVLGVQHRMRPEISKLIVPAIYSSLENHPSVYKYSKINGIIPCLYFIDHNEPEQESTDESKQNIHEAEFLICLARYLIQNGYKPEDITILAAYSGQMFVLWKQRKRFYDLLQDVRIAVLDNYQGEECKIILLSLVRNNESNKIGFLFNENRVCVALSRAKEGFYMMGNMDLLCRNSKIWPKIRKALESQTGLGQTLPLICQNHPEVITQVKFPKDFNKVPEGGCNQVCGVSLNCGHVCTRICHIQDRTHIETKCKADCKQILCDNGHKCPKLCYEKCEKCKVPMKRVLECSHEQFMDCYLDPTQFKCRTLVPAILPCSHSVENKPCYIETEHFRCPNPCDTRIEPCGHQCIRTCHIKNDPDHLEYKCFKPCARLQKDCSTSTHFCPKTCHEECSLCDVVIPKTRLLCSHRFKVPCSANIDNMECHKPCKKTLICGHKCKKRCYESCTDCSELVLKYIPDCGHSDQMKCSELPSRKYCENKCTLKLSCGHLCQERCKDNCTINCTELVDHNKNVDCGHKFKIPCYLTKIDVPSNSDVLLRYCIEPCNSILECKHTCSGTCSDCAQGRIHKSCAEKCGVILICGHECLIPCRETCQPCTQQCLYRCKHSICKKKCGEPCTDCTENCLRHCKHIRCSNKCGQICNVLPCTEPCDKKLQCGHPCVGFCGDPCPPLCLICNHKELTETFLGYEEEPDARYVLLEECKHVIESKGMEKWLNQDNDKQNGKDKEIMYKMCPKCKTPLSTTERYSNYIKTALADVIKIKAKFFGNHTENHEIRQELLVKVNNFKELTLYRYYGVSKFKLLIHELEVHLQPVKSNRRQTLNQILSRTFTSKIQIAENICDIFESGKFTIWNSITGVVDHVNFLSTFLLKDLKRTTNQEIADFRRELKRFNRVVQFYQIKCCPQFRQIRNNTLCNKIELQINSVSVYTDDFDKKLKADLIKLVKLVKTAIGITDKEKIEITKAMGMGPGHWFKCPNGHLYVIGDCGGAVTASRCNECGAGIGGINHRLLEGNHHTSEMDGSRYAAYSETANNLFNFDDLRNML